jgi:hypothetical protein
MRKVSEGLLLGESQLREALIRLLSRRGVVRFREDRSRLAYALLRVSPKIVSVGSPNETTAVAFWKLLDPNRLVIYPGILQTESLKIRPCSLHRRVRTKIGIRTDCMGCYHGSQKSSFKRAGSFGYGPVGSV